MLFTLTCCFGILFPDDSRLLWLGLTPSRKLLVQCRNAFQTRCSFVRDSPLPEQKVHSFANIGVNSLVTGQYPQAFQERLIGKGFLEP